MGLRFTAESSGQCLGSVSGSVRFVTSDSVDAKNERA